MARPLRLLFPGGLYHVTTRGNARQVIFTDEIDHLRFLDVLAAAVERHHLLCHAYCLMANHFHLLVETPEGNLSQAMRQMNGVYSQRFNRRHGRSGHVLASRFHAQVVDKERYLRAVCRYIVLNPVRAGLAAHPRQWRWSSYRATAGEVAAPAFLAVDWVLALGGTATRAAAECRYRRFVEAGLEGVPGASPARRAALVMGDAATLAPVRDRVLRAATLTEIPRAQRFALRPPLAALFAGTDSVTDRNARCLRAVREHGYTMKAVAEFLGVHCSTVSLAVTHAAARPRSWISRPDPSPTGMLDCKT